ncbi:MAG: carboxypeptidase-like regulatory domain-containing protein, partial [Flavobacteriales bacterium]
MPSVFFAFSLRWLILLSLLWSIDVAFAQLTKVSGVVKDAQTKEPLSFASVMFKGTTVGTITEWDGTFVLEIQRPVDSLVVNMTGYREQRIKIQANK